MHAGYELAAGAQHVIYRTAHARHDAHIRHHVRTVRQFHAYMGDRRAERAHRKWDNEHRTAAHATVEETVQRETHFRRIDPVVRRTSLFRASRADERPVFHPRDVGWIRARKVGIRPFGGIEAFERAGIDHLL